MCDGELAGWRVVTVGDWVWWVPGERGSKFDVGIGRLTLHYEMFNYAVRGVSVGGVWEGR